MKHITRLLAVICLACMASPASAQFSIQYDIDDFGLSPQFNQLNTFSFTIDVDEPLVAGGVYNNPILSGVQYNIFGVLPQGSPSGFPAFNLVRNIGGAEFYTQGSSLNFEISSAADLSDGLQASELVADGIGRIFEFTGREVGTGRYHPALVELFADGTGRIQNSNNFGGDNPSDDTDEEIDVNFGEEYIVDLTFDSNLLLAVPEPSSACLLGIAMVAGLTSRRRRA